MAGKFWLINLAFVFVISLAACGSVSPPDIGTEADLTLAKQALVQYLTLLHQKEYARAAAYVADDADFWQVLRDNNPGVEPEDRAGLLRGGCELQGVCLEVRQVARAEKVSEGVFVFVVEFSNEDGTLFELGPCCGANATDFPPQSQFEFRIVLQEGAHMVYGGPIYVP